MRDGGLKRTRPTGVRSSGGVQHAPAAYSRRHGSGGRSAAGALDALDRGASIPVAADAGSDDRRHRGRHRRQGAQLPAARSDVPRPDRGLRQERTCSQRHHPGQPQCAGQCRRPRRPLCVRSGPVGPLHCVPIIVKDNYDTADMPTTAGSLSLKGSIPPRDAYMVRKLARGAGAIVLAKSNMAEFARSPYETVSSILPGHTRNPYALPIASPLARAAAPLRRWRRASERQGSAPIPEIRSAGPASHASLVGIRSPTLGLTQP